MIDLKIEIDDEVMEFNIPESWAEVTVEQYIDSLKIDRDNLKEIDIMIELLGVFCDVDRDIVEQMPYDKFNELILVLSFTNEPIKEELADSVMVGEEEYFLKKDFTSLTMGEIISVEALIGSHEDLSMAIPELLCIFLRKKKENGKLEKFKSSFLKRADSFKKLSIESVHQVFFYFSDGKNLSLDNMKDSLEKEEK